MPDKHLIQRGPTWHYRRRVPTDVADLIGQRHWRATLRTTDLIEARRKAALLNADAEHAITIARAELQRQRSTIARLTPTEREVLEAAGGLDALRKTTLGEAKPKSFAQTGLSGEADVARVSAEMFTSALPGSRPTDDDLAEGPELDQLRDDLAEAEARATALRQRLDRNLAILRKDPTATDIPDDPKAAPAPTLQTILDRWAIERKAPEQHVEQYGYAVKRFHELQGALALAEITRAHLRQFKDAISKLPRSTRADIRRASLVRAISIADKEDLPRVDDRTARKHVLALTTLLRHATSWGYIDQSPADGLRFVKPRGKVSTAARRTGFTPAQLRAIDASLAGEYQETDDNRWIPLVAAYQGARLEEVCQLTLADIRELNGIWTMRITDLGVHQKVKNAASLRILPIHQALVDRGFLEHIKRSKGPLVFATLKPDQRGRLGGPYGKRFYRHLHTRTKIVDPALSFHSLRHSFKSAARNAGIPEEVQAALMGHTQGSAVASKYGEAQAAAVLAPHLNKIDPFRDPDG